MATLNKLFLWAEKTWKIGKNEWIILTPLQEYFLDFNVERREKYNPV